MKHNSYKQVKLPSDSWNRLAFIVLLYTLLLFEGSCWMFTPKNLKVTIYESLECFINARISYLAPIQSI